MLSTIDSKPQLFSFLGEIRKAQSIAQKAETYLDDYIQNLDRFPDREKTKGSWDIRGEMEELEAQMECLEAQNDYLIEMFPGDLPDRYFQRLKALRKSGAAFAGDQVPSNAYLSLDDAQLRSNHLQGVHKALRALVHYLETECEIRTAGPTPTTIVSPTAPATESTDPKPTEPKPKAKGIGRKGRPSKAPTAEDVSRAIKEDDSMKEWSAKKWAEHWGCSPTAIKRTKWWRFRMQGGDEAKGRFKDHIEPEEPDL